MAQVFDLGDLIVVQAQLAQLRQAWQVVDPEQALEAEPQHLDLPIAQVCSLLGRGLHIVIELQRQDTRCLLACQICMSGTDDAWMRCTDEQHEVVATAKAATNKRANVEEGTASLAEPDDCGLLALQGCVHMTGARVWA